MKDQERLKKLLAETANEVVSDDLDLWPGVREGLKMRPLTLQPRRLLGVLPLLAVMVVVALAALLVIRPGPDDNSGDQGSGFSAQNATATVTLPPTNTPIPADVQSSPTAIMPEPSLIPGVEATGTPFPSVDPVVSGTPTIAGPVDIAIVTATPIPMQPDQVTVEAHTLSDGVPAPDLTFTLIEAANFINGLFSHSGTLFWQTPRADYALMSVPQDAFQAAGGWAVITVKGDYFVPNLLAEKTVAGESVSASYRTSEGALLFHFADNLTPLDENWTIGITYNIIVDGNLTTLSGSYTLMVAPAVNPVDLSGGPADLVIPQLQPMPLLRFTPQAGTSYRLHVQVVSGVDQNAPDIAVLLPGGETLTKFNPYRTPYLSADFMPTVAEGDQYILIYPQDVCEPGIPLGECRFQTRQDIVLNVWVEPSGAASQMELQPTVVPVPVEITPTSTPLPTLLPAAPVVITATPIPATLLPSSLEVTATATPVPDAANMPSGDVSLPDGTVAVTIPVRFANGSWSGMVGQNIDIVMEYLLIDVPTDSSSAAVTPVQGEGEPRLVFSTFAEDVPVVSVGPSEDVITVAVLPNQGPLLTWAVEAQIPLYVLPTEADTSETVYAVVPRATVAGQEIMLEDTVDFIFPTIKDLDVLEDGTIQAEMVAEGETNALPYAVLNAHVSQILLLDEEYATLVVEIGPRGKAVLEWAFAESDLPFEVLRRTSGIVVSGEPAPLQIPVNPTPVPVTATPIAATPIGANPTPLEGTIRLPEGTVGVSLPEDDYVVAEGEASDYVGRYVDLVGVVGFTDESAMMVVELPSTIAIGEDGTTLVEAHDGQQHELYLRTMTIVEGGQVVSAGPYLANFSNDSPQLRWKYGLEKWGAITVAIPENQVSQLEWFRNSPGHIYVVPAEEVHGDALTLDINRANVEEQNIGEGDVVDLVFPTVRRLEMEEGRVVEATFFEEGDPYTVPYVIPNAQVTSTEFVGQSGDGPELVRVNMMVLPQLWPVVQWADASGVPIELVKRSGP